ncbi:MAG: UDP-3-O-(3-hydroxymyristoyl)glucosamine N-acyltransferase [Pseudarcicella sp.]|nr:UDP-3-O-(3-hydroxymyristoyl)glucosamine N-acyltransferase [Pseudarcicella sp.]MBP6409467.1 UDP-3-O-(3-hydroxymyristoyl)glucosamine N-acyltransferase [Pseudarcicella sp.]
MELTVNQIANLVDGEVEGDGTLVVNQLAKIEEGGTGTISFLSNMKYEQFVYSTSVSAIIVNKSFVPKTTLKTTLIRVEDSYVAFTKLLLAYQKMITKAKNGIEQPSFLSKDVTHGENFYLGAFSYIASGVTIGNNVQVYPNVTISENVSIGDNTIIYAGVKIYKDTIIGANCIIHSNVVIGSDGFGFAPQSDGSYEAIPQLGNVVLKDNVSIGASSTIDRATLGSTVLHEGVKLDNLVQVAHNVEIGKNTVIASQTGIAGSTKIGENCVIGGQVGFSGHLKIASKTTITGKTGVTKSVLKEGYIISGTPAMEHKLYLKSVLLLKKLPEIEKRLVSIELKK